MAIVGPPVSGGDLIGGEQDAANLRDAAGDGSVLPISVRCFGRAT